MATIGTVIFTWLQGKQVGRDEFGNRYFEARREDSAMGRKRRWVIYKGMAEPSKVPAHWHSWLHYTTDRLPEENAARKYPWQKPHLPNLTGTPYRHLPQGNILRGGKHAPSASGDYEAWKP